MVCCPVLVWHDARVGGILVDEDMVRSLVRTICENVGLLALSSGNRQETGHDGVFQPVGEWLSIEEGVSNKV